MSKKRERGERKLYRVQTTIVTYVLGCGDDEIDRTGAAIEPGAQIMEKMNDSMDEGFTLYRADNWLTDVQEVDPRDPPCDIRHVLDVPLIFARNSKVTTARQWLGAKLGRPWLPPQPSPEHVDADGADDALDLRVAERIVARGRKLEAEVRAWQAEEAMAEGTEPPSTRLPRVPACVIPLHRQGEGATSK